MSTSRVFGFAGLAVAASVLLAYVAVRANVPSPTITLLTSVLTLSPLIFLLVVTLRATTARLKFLCALSLLILVVPILVAAAITSSRWVNNWRLAEFSRQFQANAPSGVTVELVAARVGVFTGNGNHCDFVAEVQVIGELEAQAILNHYESIPIEKAVPGESSEVHMHIEQSSENRYRLTATDAPNGSAFDLRCI